MTSAAPDSPNPTEKLPDLESAIREASDHLGVSYQEGVRLPPPEAASGQSLWPRLALAAAIIVFVLGGTLLVERRVPGLEPYRVEADLRWAVSEVVEEVDRLHDMRGELPGSEELQGLLGDALQYIPEGDSYRVVGSREGVEVEFDGRIPLDQWRTLVLYPPDSS